MEKICSKCKISKDISNFGSSKQSKDKLFSWCNSCKKEYNQTWDKDNKNQRLTINKKYYKNNKDTIKRYKEEYASRPDIKSKTKNYNQRYNLKYKYNLTPEQKEQMLKDQNYCCGCCREKLNNEKICIDHDHITNIIRKLLCNNCNAALGFMHEDIEKIYKLYEYAKYCSELRDEVIDG